MKYQDSPPSPQPPKLIISSLKQELPIILITAAVLLFLVVGVGAYYLRTKQVNSKVALSNLHWQTYICKYRGYSVSIPDEVEVSMWDGWYGADPKCPREITGGISFSNSNEDLLESPAYKVIEIKNVLINGFNTKYARLEHVGNNKHLLIYQFKGQEYIYFWIDLNYKDPYTETDFHKDSEWGSMVDTSTQEQDKGKQSINIIDVFNEMAKTIKIIPALPTPTRNPNEPMIN